MINLELLASLLAAQARVNMVRRREIIAAAEATGTMSVRKDTDNPDEPQVPLEEESRNADAELARCLQEAGLTERTWKQTLRNIVAAANKG